MDKLNNELIVNELGINASDDTTIDYLLSVLQNSISEKEEFESVFDIVKNFVSDDEKITKVLQTLGFVKKTSTLAVSSTAQSTKSSPAKLKSKAPPSKSKEKSPPKSIKVEMKSKGSKSADVEAETRAETQNDIQEYAAGEGDILKRLEESSSATTKKSQEPKSTKTKSLADDMKELDEYDDYASAWEQCRNQGRLWGGRGAGGRGVKFTNSDMTDSLSLHNVSLAYAGKVLLEPCSIQLVRGRRYALIGENGVGKSTLLKSMAVGRIPGWPTGLACYYVRQDAEGSSETAVNLVMKQIFDEEDDGNDNYGDDDDEYMDDEDFGEEDGDGQQNGNAGKKKDSQQKSAQGNGSEEDEKTAKKRKEAETILLKLGFKRNMLDLPTSQLSGGFRMRVALAQGIVAKPDLLLLDEPDAHLDLVALKQLESLLIPGTGDWDKKYVFHNTLIVISHDREFLTNVATDVIEFSNKKLNFFPSDYADYIQRQGEKKDANLRRFAAAERQKAKAKEFIEKQSSGKNKLDDKKQKQVRQKKDKLERIGYFRDDGHKFKLHGLRRLDEESVRLPEVPLPPSRDPNVRFNFPDPSEIGGAPNAPLMTLDEVSAGYAPIGSKVVKPLLSNVTLQVRMSSKIAVMGRNGEGKSTLMKLLLGEELTTTKSSLSIINGTISRKSGLKIAYVGQHSADILKDHMEKNSVEVLMELQKQCDTVEKARSHLGAFGISGNTALILVGKLSGGQRTRLLLALALWGHPHIIMLDEPTNGLSVSAIQALEHGLKEFKGAFIVISHDRALLKNCARELWIVGNGKVQIAVHDDYHLRGLAYGGNAKSGDDSDESEDEEEIEFREHFQDKFDESLTLLFQNKDKQTSAGATSASASGKKATAKR